MSKISARARRVVRYGQGVVGLRGEDVILTSFPKSGSTWVRFFLRNLISVSEREGELVTFPLLDATMPELGVSNLLKRWPYDTIPRFVKTHRPYVPLFRGRRSVLVVRDPRDVMASYYRYMTGMLRPRFDGSFADFVRHKQFGLRAWCVHYRSWLKRRPVRVRYEELRADDVRAFGTMLEQTGVNVSADAVVAAAKRARLEEVRRIEKKYGVRKDEAVFRAGVRFAGAGTVGTWKQLFSSELLEEYEAIRVSYGIEAYENAGEPLG